MDKTTSYINYAGLLEFLHLTHKNTDLYLSHCGMQQCEPGHRFGNQPRPEYHLHFILDGQGSYVINNQKFNLRRGQLFVIPPNVSSYYYQADMKKPWYYAWIAFNGEMADQYMAQAGFDDTHIIRNSNIAPEEFTGYIYEMLKASQLTASNELDRIGCLFLIMARLIESNTNNSAYDYSGDTYVEHALQYIQFNYNRNIQINDIVNYVGMNRSYFSQLFKQQMAVSPKEYLQQFRMDKAKSLLDDSALSVTDIATSVGYSDPFTFSKSFKKLVGQSPREYRNRRAVPST